MAAALVFGRKVMFPEFSFAFQPIINVTTHSIVAYEALLRGPAGQSAWQVINGVQPAQKYDFDCLIRERAIMFAAQLGIQCAIHLNFLPHALEILSSAALDTTLAAADRATIAYQSITLELTELDVISRLRHFADALNQYRAKGVCVMIDDFGAGYSGLNLLAEFQPDGVKIDMSLIRNIHKSGPRQAIVRGVIRTCLDLGIDVVAEGVETLDEYLWCFDEGIALFQGYLLAKPGFEYLPLAFFPNIEP